MTREKCKATVMSQDGWPRAYPCANKATRDGWCGVNHPDAVANREAKKQARWKETEAAWNRDRAIREATRAALAACLAILAGEAGAVERAKMAARDYTNATEP